MIIIQTKSFQKLKKIFANTIWFLMPIIPFVPEDYCTLISRFELCPQQIHAADGFPLASHKVHEPLSVPEFPIDDGIKIIIKGILKVKMNSEVINL